MVSSRFATACAVAATLVSLSVVSGRAWAEPRYLPLIREELAKLGLRATCTTKSPSRASCSYLHRSSDGATQFDMRLDYSDDSDTIYHYSKRYLALPASNPRVLEVLRRLMHLNWTMLIGKFQWNPEDGEIRLSAVENTDSNFDRRAFRSTVRSFHNLAERYHGELSALVREGGAGSPPAKAPP